ncbi:hypothetical protein EVAR_60254_1 [Eumeta japonica]|uniref:Uncharacterized protein n=1 Tax=Eumeta variegata TaxID=151549 RepID=A0A4C1ZE45_EUMVA|nr:hypothetical protein EVAR_60254_1 [Eumeta japonica]
MDVDHIKQMIDLNYFGTAYPTKYVLPGMKKRREGIIVFVSTEAALIGIYGYSAYGSAKWAVRGLAEALMMELIGSGVRLTLAFPPDTDTPGFKTEELTKPEETKLISASGGLHSAEEVGRKIVQDALKKNTFGYQNSVQYSLLYDDLTACLTRRSSNAGEIAQYQKGTGPRCDHFFGKGLTIDEQFGFRPANSCPQQVLRLVEYVSEGFKTKQKTVAVFFDVAKAFDRVWLAEQEFLKTKPSLPCCTPRTLTTYRVRRPASNSRFSLIIPRSFLGVGIGAPSSATSRGPLISYIYGSRSGE